MQQYKKENDIWKCLLCDRIGKTKQSVVAHIFRTHTRPGISFGGHRKGTPAWNRGLRKENDERVLKNALALRGKTSSFKGKKHTEETRKKISQKMTINNKGGRCKWFEVSGQKVQGTWERDIANKFEELGIKWSKIKTNNHTFEYYMDDKLHSYTPDFYLHDYDVYLEIKGHWWGKDKEKMDIVKKTYPNNRIIIIEKNEYKKIMQGELVW